MDNFGFVAWCNQHYRPAIASRVAGRGQHGLRDSLALPNAVGKKEEDVTNGQ